MPTTEDKLVQHMIEARAMELALARTLEAHLAMTPTGEYRNRLRQHLHETRDHAERIERRLADLGRRTSVTETVYDLGQRLAGQAIALGKTPLDLLRGGSPEEQLLKNAKDEAASEALEIATYDAIERLAELAGDEETARLASAHRADEEQMLATLRELIPGLTAAVVGAEVGREDEGGGSGASPGRAAAEAARGGGAASAERGAAEAGPASAARRGGARTGAGRTEAAPTGAARRASPAGDRARSGTRTR